MKALVWEGPRLTNMRETPEPVAADDEVVLHVAFAGICGSELSGYLGHNALRKPPLVMGHEFAGEIVSLGKNAASINPKLQVGSRVTANPLQNCGVCVYCKRGLTQLCVARKLIGAARPGAYAEFVSVPAHLVAVLPEGMSLETGALTEPVAVGVRIAKMLGDMRDENVLIIGAGPIGLLAMQALKLRGVRRVFISDLDKDRLEMGRKFGGEILNPRETDVVSYVKQETGGLGVAATVDAVGSGVTRAQAVNATRSAGTVILSGLHEEASPLPVSDAIRREMVLRGVFAYTPEDFAEALDLLARKRIDLAPWIVKVPLEEGGAWFDRLVDAPGAVAKVLLVP